MCAQKKQANQSSETPILKTITEKDLGISIDKTLSPREFAIGIRKLLQNWRQGTVGVKTRAEVSLTGKKPFKQKGTGRARAGSARSPLWRKGGVAFGPQPRTRQLKVTKKMQKGLLRSLFADYALNNKVYVLDWQVSSEKPKTSQAYKTLKSVGLADKKISLFVPFQDRLTYASFVNLPNVNVMFFDEPNLFDLTGHDWLVLNKDLEAFKQMVSQWLN